MNDLLDFLRTHEEAFRSRNRLQSLYSDFRLQKTSNPDGYLANSQTWLRGLTAAALAGKLPPTTSAQPSHVILSSGEELSRALNSAQWGRPLALGAVIQDAVDKRKFIALEEFMAATKSVYARGGWLPSPLQVVRWGLRQVGFGGGDKLAVGNFVVMANVEEAAKAIIAKAAQTDQSITSRVYTRQLFEAEFGLVLDKTASSSGSLSSTDFDILLCYLSRDKPQLCISSTTIKLKSTSESTPQPITEEDTAIANLRTLIPALQSQVSALTDRIATLETTARTAITANRIAQAKTALRSKKLAETTLSTRSATLSQLEETFTAIQTAADQVAMVTAMSASTAVLGSLHAQVGGTEGVEEVVGRLREEMENVDQVGRVIQEGNTGVRVDDEADVEDEFAALEAAERERVKMVEMERKRKREEREAQVTAERLRALDEVEGERNELDKDETWKGEMQAESG